MSQESGFSPSRREFLKAMGATAFLVGLGIPSDVTKQWEKQFGDKELLPYSFEEGMHLLKDHVWEKKTESARVYIEKEAQRGWIDVTTGETSDSAEINIDLLNSLFTHDVSKIYLAHSHPYDIYRSAHLLDDDAIAEIVSERKSIYPILPTGNDVLLAAQTEGKLTERALAVDRLRHYVVEPNGIWRYHASIKHPQIEKIFGALEDEKTMPVMTLIWGLEEWRSRIVKDGGLNEKNLAEFTKWAKDEYGITFSHSPHY